MHTHRSLGFAALAGLCLLLGSRWLVDQAWPGAAATPASGTVAAGVGALGWVLFAALRRSARGASAACVSLPGAEALGGLIRAGVGGGMLFAGTSLRVLPARAAPTGESLLMALSLAPVVVALALAVRRRESGGVSGMELAPGLLALVGLLLILPVPSLSNPVVDAVLLAVPVLTGLGAVLVAAGLAELSERRDWAKTAAAALAGAALGYLCLGVLARGHGNGVVSGWGRPTLTTTALDLAVLLLTLLVLRGLGARRYAAVFSAVPLLLLLEGAGLERVLPSWQQGGGLVLLLASAVLLLRGSPETGTQNDMRLFG